MEAICLTRKSELSRNEAYKNIIDKEMIDLCSASERPDGVYIQEEKAATYEFCMPGRRGPSWGMIMRRITVAMPSLVVLENLTLSCWDTWTDLVRPLPNPVPQKITTIFFWNHMRSVPAIMQAVAGSGPRLRVLYLADYSPRAQMEVCTGIVRNALTAALPHYEVVVLRGDGPFTDADAGDSSFFDGNQINKSPKDLALCAKRDLLTSIAQVMRMAVTHDADVIVGHGQGGLLALAMSRPELLETAMAMRNVQREEVGTLAAAWGKLRAVVASSPRISMTHPKKFGVALLQAAAPELFGARVLTEPLRCIYVQDVDSPSRAVEDSFAAVFDPIKVRRLEDVLWGPVLEQKARFMWGA